MEGPGNPLGLTWEASGLSWDPLWDPLGLPWDPLRNPWEPPGTTFGASTAKPNFEGETSKLAEVFITK